MEYLVSYEVARLVVPGGESKYVFESCKLRLRHDQRNAISDINMAHHPVTTS